MIRPTWLVAKTVLIEAVRRREVYAIVLVSVLIIGAVLNVDFFGIRGLSKFYAEVALRVMTIATALTVIALSVRQLPREFEARTVYPLLAKPIGRPSFLAGKALGVVLAAAFCLALFMLVYVGGSLYLRTGLHYALLAQFIYLQLVGAAVLTSLGLWLSLIVNVDAAATLAIVLYFGSGVISAASSYLYDYATAFGKAALWAENYAVPQLNLFDLTDKAVHGESWPPLSPLVMAELTAYGAFFSLAFMALANLAFRRRAL